MSGNPVRRRRAAGELVVGEGARPTLHDDLCECLRCSGFRSENLAALKSGAWSEQLLRPLRERHARELAEDYPHLDPRRLAILADRLARMDSARAWLDQMGGVVRDADGTVFGVVKELERWANRAEAVLGEAEVEARRIAEVDPVLALRSRGREALGTRGAGS